MTDRSQLQRDAPEFSESDIEDAMAYQREKSQPQDDDAIMMDTSMEDDELEAMLASYEEQQSRPSQQPPSPALSDQDYDEFFAELIAQENNQRDRYQDSEDRMDMTDGT